MTDNPFQLFNMKPCLFVDREVLHHAYRVGMQKTHPDLFLDAFEKKAAETVAARLSHAFEQLKSPIYCLTWIMTDVGLSWQENEVPHNQAVLSRMMDYHMTMMESDTDQHHVIREDLNHKLIELSTLLLTAYENRDHQPIDPFVFKEMALTFLYVYRFYERYFGGRT